MKFLKEFAGKWVAIKGEKVIDSSETLKDLMQKTRGRKDQEEVGYSLVPKAGPSAPAQPLEEGWARGSGTRGSPFPR